MSQPGEVDPELNEFWVGNPFEIYMSQNLSSFERNRLFVNDGAGGFVDVSFSTGLDADSDGRCSVPLDIDNDGRMDLLLRQAGGGPLQLLRNQFPPSNFLSVTLQGTASNRQGIGARLVAQVGPQKIVREVYPTNTYRSQRPLAAHFGLGTADHVDQLSILWPSGAEQQLSEVEGNQHIFVTEGQAQWVPILPGEPLPPADPPSDLTTAE
ncbi:MAG: CRTAC1 family protein [Fuerstiella sp.]